MRLHEYEKVVEAIRQALLRVKPGKSDRELLGEAYARAALDALLDAAVRLGVGYVHLGKGGYTVPHIILQLEEPQHAATINEDAALILRLEKARDEARNKALAELASALQKFAPDLMAELVRRFKEADDALDEFLAALKSQEPTT